jgi:hypothetical protein
MLIYAAQTLSGLIGEDQRRLSQVNLLVFNDLKGVKPDHAWAIFLYMHYRILQQPHRPRIFSFLTSNDYPAGFDSHLLSIEELMYSRIFGIPLKIREDIMAINSPAQDRFITYDKDPEKPLTGLAGLIADLSHEGGCLEDELKLAEKM